MEPNIILSLHPEWWKRILSEEKTLEIRKTAPHPVYFPLRVIVYLTVPVCRVVGEFTCITARKITGSYEEIAAESCLRPCQLKNYADGKAIRAWEISNPIQYEKPRRVEDYGMKRPPQSWCYLERGKAPMDDTMAVELLRNADTDLRYMDRRNIANIIENLRSAANQSNVKTEQFKQINAGLAKEAQEEKSHCAALESSLYGICRCCENRKHSYAKLRQPTIQCTRRKKEVPADTRISNCPFWKFKVPEVPK